MNDTESRLREDVVISVERMMRFCHLAQMTFEYSSGDTKALPLHLTRFGVLVFETASFLYSLFEDRRDSINLRNVWQGFDHPFNDELQNYVTRLSPFKEELRFVRNRVGFHETGSQKLYIDNSATPTPLIYGEFDNDLVRVNGTLETVWAGSNLDGDGLSKLLLLEANNDVVELKSDVGFALRNARADFQWNFRTAEIVEGFIATKEGTGGAEFTIENPTDDYKNVILTLGNGAKNVSGVWINASSEHSKRTLKNSVPRIPWQPFINFNL